PYDASNSGGSNLAPSNAKLIAQVKNRVHQVRMENDLAAAAPIPADLVLTSASGLDPHISPPAARLQARRVAQKRKIPLADVESLIKQNTEEPLGQIWGKARVNVLDLNLALDALKTEN
ncbi:MAG: potassium-transporting ATPase subunit C, partial [Deltaproteobacteria bacterium]|nr:potassium-transporting ATPase subunit C [Deltaproteobacteria bacterium]